MQWNSSRAVDKIIFKPIRKLFDDLAGKATFLKPAATDRTRFKYQFRIDVRIDPAEVVAGALSAALDKTMQDPDNSHPQRRMPTVRVSNLQTFRGLVLI